MLARTSVVARVIPGLAASGCRGSCHSQVEIHVRVLVLLVRVRLVVVVVIVVVVLVVILVVVVVRVLLARLACKTIGSVTTMFN